MPKAKRFHLAANYSRFAMRARAAIHHLLSKKAAAAIKVHSHMEAARLKI
jgi:hypothetical protein